MKRYRILCNGLEFQIQRKWLCFWRKLDKQGHFSGSEFWAWAVYNSLQEAREAREHFRFKDEKVIDKEGWQVVECDSKPLGDYGFM